MKAKSKRFLSLFMAMVFCFSLLGTLPAFAATTVQAYMVNYPRQNDPNYGDSRFGHSANYLMSGWAYVAYERMTLHAIGSYNGQIAYCIEPGVDQDSGDTLTSTDESYWDNYPASSNVTIPPETIKTLLGRVLTYGYHGNISQDWMTGNASDADSLSYAIATQMLVWEVVVGERDANFDHVDPSAYGKGAVMDYIGASNPLRSQIMSYYNQIIENIKTHNVMPSFCAPLRDYARAYELEQDGSEYTLTLTDSNGVLDNYAFSADRYPGAPEIDLRTIRPEVPFDVAGFHVVPVTGRHYILPVTGYRIGPLAYLTDFNSIEESELRKLEGIDTLVINALRYTKHISHFTVEEAIAVSRRIAPRRTYLTHMSHQIGPYEKVHGTLPEGIEFAWDGLKIDIND